jgi:alpha-L-fucosidase
MATYDSTSPYFTTPYSQFFLDVMTNRAIPKQSDDVLTTITLTYQYRPDLLSYDLYGTPTLWWVFYQRNPNTLVAPPWDFQVGTRIYLPNESTLKSVLGY